MAKGKFVSCCGLNGSTGKSGLGLERPSDVCCTEESYLDGGRWKIIKEFLEVESRGRRA